MVAIQVAGHVCVDLTPKLHSESFGVPGELTEVGPIEVRMGGALSNCARVVKALNTDVFLSGMVGDDEFGGISRDKLEQEHPGHVDLTVHPTAATSYSIVINPPGLDRSFLHHTGANDEFRGLISIHPNTILHFGYPTLCPGMCENDGAPIVDLFTRAGDAGCATSLDLAYLATNSPLQRLDWSALFANALPHSDVFCPSWDDIASCLPEVDAAFDPVRVEAQARAFLDMGAAIVLITVGRHGAHLATAGAQRLARLASLTGIDAEQWAHQSLWHGAVPVENTVSEPLDTNGAGDTFKAAFLVALTKRAPASRALAYASHVVARKLVRRPMNIAIEEL